MNISRGDAAPLLLRCVSGDPGTCARWSDVVKRLARLADISFADRAPEGAVQLLVRGEVAALPLKGVIDLAAEKTRLDKELAKAEADISGSMQAWHESSSPMRRKTSRGRKRKREARGAEGENCRSA